MATITTIIFVIRHHSILTFVTKGTKISLYMKNNLQHHLTNNSPGNISNNTPICNYADPYPIITNMLFSNGKISNHHNSNFVYRIHSIHINGITTGTTAGHIDTTWRIIIPAKYSKNLNLDTNGIQHIRTQWTESGTK